MASSGTMNGNTVDNSNKFFVNWQLASQNIGANTSTINWQAKWKFVNNDRDLDNGNVVINGSSRWDNGGRVYNFSSNFTTRDLQVASGSFTIGHNSDGTKTFNINGALTGFSGATSSGSANFALPTIPRASQPSLGANPTTIGNNMVIYTNRLSSSFTHTVEASFGAWSATLATGVSTSYTWNTSTVASSLYDQIPNNTSGVGNITLKTYSGGTLVGTKTVSFTLNVNTTTSAPTFVDFDYVDTNATTVAITGNNQLLIQGKSTLTSSIVTADKMIPLNSSTADEYTSSIDGAVVTQPYSAVSTVSFAMGTIAGSGTRNLILRAFDSRGLSTSVTKAITVIPYSAPTIVATAERDNGFENATTLTVSGTFSPVTVSAVAKNNIVAGSLEYRYRQDGGAWGSWVDLAFTQGSGAFTASLEYLSLTNSSTFDFEVRVTDKLSTTTQSLSVGRGVPVFMISDNLESIGVNKMPDTGGRKGLYLEPTDNIFNMIYPIGIIVELAVSTNPSTFWGGTWVAHGTGRVTVAIDTGQSEFDSVGETGGAKTSDATHKHRMPFGWDANNFYAWNNASGNPVFGDMVTPTVSRATFSKSNASGGTRVGYTDTPDTSLSELSRLQPYIVVYRWRRTA